MKPFNKYNNILGLYIKTYMLYSGALCLTKESLIPYLFGPGAQFLKKNVLTLPMEYSGAFEPFKLADSRS